MQPTISPLPISQAICHSFKEEDEMEKCILGPRSEEGSGGFKVTNFITDDTTPEAFDAFCQELPKYKFEYGGRCGWNALGTAASKGNIPLVRHIIKIGSPNLINLGNTFGAAPLFCAVLCDNLNGDEIAKILMEHGAVVNMATVRLKFRTSNLGSIFPYSTPLQAAAEKTKNLRLIQRLLLHGGIIHRPLSQIGRDNINAAIQQLFDQTKMWAILPDPNSPFQRLNNKIIVLLIQNYV